ncbi:MAG: hypothetical protein ISS77_03625 [Phycisphaerae bacterium]|nr:hypothetical protein [Phycisphaerae bacterium]
MTGREIIKRTIKFESPGCLGWDFLPEYGSDIVLLNMDPSPDGRPQEGVDEWGAVWENIGVSKFGEVKDYPLKDWKDFDGLPIPDINDPKRWESIKGVREKYGEKFLLGIGVSLYERLHFIRGLENTWADIYINPDELEKFIEILVDMNLGAIEKYAKEGFDGYIWPDDWGLQDRLMISPDKWRQFWKKGYERVFSAAHEAGMLTFLHSCGNIVEILDDLIEVGLDVIQMDQQENMGLEALGERFAGRVTFYCPVDIQATMVGGSVDDIRAYCRKMVKCLGTDKGGFIPKCYMDPVGAGHRQEAIDAMCKEFIRLSNR